MKAYYEDDYVTIYHGDCREILPGINPDDIDLVLTDPPYGVAEATNRAERGRSNLAASNDMPPVLGDDEPFDPAHLLGFRALVLWGANHYSDRLPPSASMIVWDKLDGLETDKRAVGFDDNADVEIAWSNLGGPARILRHRWKGMLKASERDEPRVHPTQKPVWLMERILEWRTPIGGRVLDPYMGSGPVPRAAKNLGRKCIGIELDERYCEIAAKRLAQEVLDLGGVA